ncbi:MAG: hypothetical protein ABI746_04605 [Dermatophilaceae bacterium]
MGGTRKVEEKPKVPIISAPGLVAGAGAAVSSAYVGASLGIAGTLIGAAVGSVVTTISIAYYSHMVARLHDRVRVGATRRQDPSAPTPRRQVRLSRRFALGALAAFAIGVGAVTAIELGLGHPLSGNERSGTSVGVVVQDAGGQQAPRPTTTPTRVPSQGATTAPATQPPTDGPTTRNPSLSESGVPSTPTAPQDSLPTAPAAPTQAPQAPGTPAPAPTQAPVVGIM